MISVPDGTGDIGKNEFLNWEPSDLFQLCNDTVPIQGSIDEALAVVDGNEVNKAIKIGVCNICPKRCLLGQRNGLEKTDKQILICQSDQYVAYRIVTQKKYTADYCGVIFIRD